MPKPIILCVDDEKIILTSLKEQLKRHFARDYHIETVESGEEALEVIEEVIADTIDLPIVISDHIMPGMKGDELLAQIHCRLPKTLKILLTGQANADAVGNAVNRANLYRYIAKPWEQADLNLTVTEAIRSYFQDKKLQEQNAILTQMNQDLEQLNTAYERFVPREFLGFLDKQSVVDLLLGDHVERDLTILFSDIRDFTTISEQMTAEENFQFINTYLGRMGPIVRQHQGFIDKYIGDAIMALFPRHADNALQAAIMMLRVLADYNQARQATGKLPIQIGIGINTGLAMLGIIGEHGRMDGTVISDAVNLASRLEGLTKRYKASILVSEPLLTRLARPEQYHVRFLGKVQVKGKTETIQIYEVFDGDSERFIDLKHKTKPEFKRGLEHYFSREFIKAMGDFTQVLAVNPDDKAAQLYVERCAGFISQGVPECWQGVEVVDSK
jgi:adenylate cyclase